MKSIVSFSLLVLSLLVAITTAALAKPPVLEANARVKQHRAGAQGALVEGEEDLLKMIVFWSSVPDAIDYQIQRDWKVVDEETGDVLIEEGTVETSFAKCGGRPCLVVPGATRGLHTVMVRAKLSSSTEEEAVWTLWSEPAHYLVDDSTMGMSPHVPQPHDEL